MRIPKQVWRQRHAKKLGGLHFGEYHPHLLRLRLPVSRDAANGGGWPMMPNENRRTCDVAVIGGGPAGAAMATWLARSGHACVVLERAAFPRYPIGDALIPHTLGPLDILGSFEAGLWECVNTLRRLNHAVLTIDFTSQTSPTATLSPAPP